MKRSADRDWIVTVAFFGGLLLVWQAIVRGFDVHKLILPAPSEIVESLVRGLASGLYTEHLGYTLAETVMGFVIGAIGGIAIGAIVAQFRIMDKTVYPVIIAVQSIPKVAMVPLLVLWFGYDMASKVATAALISFFPVLVNVVIGLRITDRAQLDLFSSLRASRWQTFRMVQLPNALPYIFAGFDVGVVYAMLGALVGEFVGGRYGLGYVILQANFNLDVAGVFAVFVLLSAIGTVLHLIVRTCQRRYAFWVDTETPKGA